ncbi:carbonic anhydrase [Bremerella alba]|nr:carbonic anhydrase [Bremerella alba]
MIACSDQGAAPNNVSFARPGRFLVLQHLAASIRPADDYAGNSVIADIEFAFSQHAIKHVIICGHLGCGVIPYWLNYPDAPDSSGMRAHFEKTTLQVVNQAYPKYCGEARVKAMICEHTLFQIEHLCSHPFVLDRLESQLLQVHAWIVNDDTARVSAYDPISGCLAAI